MMMRTRIPKNSSGVSSRRAGAVLVVAMVSLLITSLILGSLVQMAALTRRQEQSELLRLQAEWLAESAVERAADRISADSQYTGESWRISAADFGNGNEGRVDISVEADSSGVRKIIVAAVFPSNSSSFAKVTKQVTLRPVTNTQP